MNGLFYDSDNRLFSAEEIKKALLNVGASDCETLFIHSDVMFGRPAEGFKRREYLGTLYGLVSGLEIKNIIVPTFTYSFCNNEDYDVSGSKTSMGAFNEYVRKLDGRFRTDDPLLSVSVPMELKDKFEIVSNESLGVNSALDIIHGMDNVKFLFLGAEMAECFTYVHYVEKMMNVPYRFDMPFEGNVIYPDGTVKRRTQIIYTQCTGVKLPPKYDYFEDFMFEKGYLKKVRVGDKYIGCLSETDAYREISDSIKRDEFYYCAEPYSAADLVNEYTYTTDAGRITHC
jgi:aminoglycoside 3-N-acetyltransferase